MEQKLKNIICWTTYITIAFLTLITVITLCVNLVAPTFFPDKDISGFKSYINTASIILSFLSAGLAFFSIWQARESGKQATVILNEIHEIKHKQEILSKDILKTNRDTVQVNVSPKSPWHQDRDEAYE